MLVIDTASFLKSKLIEHVSFFRPRNEQSDFAISWIKYLLH